MSLHLQNNINNTFYVRYLYICVCVYVYTQVVYRKNVLQFTVVGEVISDFKFSFGN